MACAVCGIRRRQFQKPARAFSVGACGDTNLRYTPCYRPTQRDATLRRRAATRVRVVGERKSRRAKRVNESSLNFVSGRRADCLFGLGRAVARAKHLRMCRARSAFGVGPFHSALRRGDVRRSLRASSPERLPTPRESSRARDTALARVGRGAPRWPPSRRGALVLMMNAECRMMN